MNHLLLLVAIIGAVNANEPFSNYRLLPEPVKNCTKAGPFCESCTSLVACINDGHGLTKIPLATCPPLSYCVDGACTSEFGPFCSGVDPFRCTMAGVFPDPYYCNKYHLCVGNITSGFINYMETCEPGFGFNIANDLCDIRLGNGECPHSRYPVPLCGGKDVPAIGGIKEKPAMYYICETRIVDNVSVPYPMLGLCPGDSIYNNYGCTSSPTTTTDTSEHHQ